jgi:hypothetical protein
MMQVNCLLFPKMLQMRTVLPWSRPVQNPLVVDDRMIPMQDSPDMKEYLILPMRKRAT